MMHSLRDIIIDTVELDVRHMQNMYRKKEDITV